MQKSKISYFNYCCFIKMFSTVIILLLSLLRNYYYHYYYYYFLIIIIILFRKITDFYLIFTMTFE